MLKTLKPNIRSNFSISLDASYKSLYLDGFMDDFLTSKIISNKIKIYRFTLKTVHLFLFKTPFYSSFYFQTEIVNLLEKCIGQFLAPTGKIIGVFFRFINGKKLRKMMMNSSETINNAWTEIPFLDFKHLVCFFFFFK